MSKRINWKSLVKKIPSSVQIAPKIVYQVVWQKEIVDTKGNQLYGLTDLNNHIITIKMDMSARLTVETYIHEVTHAISEHYDLGLTENQVLKIEHAIPVLVKSNNIFKEE